MKYKKDTYGNIDYYEGELYKLRMIEAKSYLVALGPDDVEQEWEVGEDHIIGVNALTSEEFNKAYSEKMKGIAHPFKTFFTEADVVKHSTKPGKNYLYEWESDTLYQLSIIVLDINLTYKINDDDKEALTNL
jgi:hypothetical protein